MREVRGHSVDSSGPWFWQHPRWALVVAAALFTGVLALRLAVAGVEDSISVLYVLPVALLALTFGFRVGVAAGFAAVGLLVSWVLYQDETLSPLGWLSRGRRCCCSAPWSASLPTGCAKRTGHSDTPWPSPAARSSGDQRQHLPGLGGDQVDARGG